MAFSLLGICGSLRKASMNRVLLEVVGEEVARISRDTRFEIWDTVDLPIFNSDIAPPAPVIALKDAIAKADGVVFAVPEYNYSIPGGLKNALDWISSPPASSPLRHKCVAMLGATSGMSGTIRAQLHMREMLLFSDCRVLGQPEVLIPRAHERLDEQGRLADESTRVLLHRFATAVLAHVARHTA